jgi:hypoxanthine-DNA glycosylase
MAGARRAAVAPEAERLRGLPAVIDRQARVMILGSFPSPASLAAGQYYAHRQNQFWPILGEVIGQPLPAMAYAARLEAIGRAGIAVWDVYAECERAGSLDSAIRAGRANDFGELVALAPVLARICFNGRTAARFEAQFSAMGYETRVLPSSSPAYTLPLPNKLALWQAALAPIA